MEIIDYNYLHDLLSLTTRLIEVVARNTENIKREVSLMGGGKVLEMESEKIYRSGVADGMSQGISQGISRGISQGISQGISDSILSVLEEYGSVPEDLRQKISNEDNIDILRSWIKLSTHVSSVDEFVNRM